MDIYHTIIRPMVTEKGTHQAGVSHGATKRMPARGGSFTFEVHPAASKPMIRQAIEKIYSVKVVSVRTSNRRGKQRRVRMNVGTTRDWKKAVVVLDANSHIDLF
ncbi:MAG: 50S ribosomal protein L23 [Phycisphaerales bacterium]|nr:50S ribosomal protein L23 [Phycisphaerales bacterium]